MISHLTHGIALTELQCIKKWHVAHRKDHPLEYHVWDTVLTLWLIGWVGWLPAFALEAWWALTPCAVAILVPRLYVGWRKQAHIQQRLRCDWMDCTR
jgi:hypothetical protein